MSHVVSDNSDSTFCRNLASVSDTREMKIYVCNRDLSFQISFVLLLEPFAPLVYRAIALLFHFHFMQWPEQNKWAMALYTCVDLGNK